MDTFERKETKYLITPAQYLQFMAIAGRHLVPAEFPEGDICSLYYDTPDYLLVNRSLEGPKYKEKLRVRSYGATAPGEAVYVEVKKKFKGVVYKRRVKCTRQAAQAFLGGMDYEDAIDRWPLADAAERASCRSWKSLQIAGEIAWMRDHYDHLAPRMLVSTHRTSLVAADDPDLRITFDADVRWSDVDSVPGSPSASRDLFAAGERILEVKCSRAFPLWLVGALDDCGIRPQSVSKYGRAYLASMALRRETGRARAPRPVPVPRTVAACDSLPARRRLGLAGLPRRIFPRRVVA